MARDLSRLNDLHSTFNTRVYTAFAVDVVDAASIPINIEFPRAGIRRRKLESQRRFDRQAARYSPLTGERSLGWKNASRCATLLGFLSASQLNVARSHVHLATRVRQLLPRDERARSVIVVVHQCTGSIGTPGRDATNRFRSSG
jgi:hypothetical protein